MEAKLNSFTCSRMSGVFADIYSLTLRQDAVNVLLSSINLVYTLKTSLTPKEFYIVLRQGSSISCDTCYQLDYLLFQNALN